MAKAKPPAPLTDALKRAITESGMSMKALAKAAGVQRMSISRFMDGQRSLRLVAADRLAEYLGLALTKRAD